MRARTVSWLAVALVVVGLFLGCGGDDGGKGGGGGAGNSAAAMTCGNGVREGTEQCDGNDLGMSTCMSLGKQMGLLKCNPTTCFYDTSMCPALAPIPGGNPGNAGNGG